MTMAALIRQMAAAGAPAEAIALAVEAIEAAEAKVEAVRAAARDRKRRQRDVSRDSHGTVTGHSGDGHAQNPPPPPSSPKPPTTPTPAPETGVTRPRKAAPSKRCPEAWTPSSADLGVGLSEGFTPGEIERELAKFRDHTFGTARTDWSPTFRNWLRKAAERQIPRERANRNQDGRPGGLAQPAGAGGYRPPVTGLAGVVARRRSSGAG